MLSLIKALLSVVSHLSKFAADRQLIQAGEHKAIVAGIAEADDAINRARRAAAAVRHDADSVRDDPANRDNP
ncbi:MAG TPA: hypothetical protein VIG24_12415 [Acidimicrobiia bacterium]